MILAKTHCTLFDSGDAGATSLCKMLANVEFKNVLARPNTNFFKYDQNILTFFLVFHKSSPSFWFVLYDLVTHQPSNKGAFLNSPKCIYNSW